MLLLRIVFYFSVIMLAVSYTLEFVVGLSPCIICEIQRLILLPVIFLTILDFNLKNIWCTVTTRLMRLLASIIALYLGWHHVYLINNPVLVSNTCLPKLFTIFSNQGLQAAWQQIILGGPACTKIQWQAFGFNLPELALMAYGVLFLLIILEIYFFIKLCLTNNTQLT